MPASNSRTDPLMPQKPGRPAYEELQPRFEWKDNASSHVLNVFLPGFFKEQMKLTYDEPTRSLNVRGERAVGTGRFVLFNKDIKVPDNARFKEMRARFQSETLIVTVPKQTLTSPPPPPPLPPLPPQAPKPDRITFRRTEVRKEDDRLNNKAQEGDGPGKLPPTGEKVDNRMEKERPSTLIPPAPLAPLPNPTTKPVPTPAPSTKVPKANNGMKDRPMEQDDSVKLPPLKEMKVGMEEERKLMVNVVMAVIVLVAIGAYICYYTLAGHGRNKQNNISNNAT